MFQHPPEHPAKQLSQELPQRGGAAAAGRGGSGAERQRSGIAAGRGPSWAQRQPGGVAAGRGPSWAPLGGAAAGRSGSGAELQLGAAPAGRSGSGVEIQLGAAAAGRGRSGVGMLRGGPSAPHSSVPLSAAFAQREGQRELGKFPLSPIRHLSLLPNPPHPLSMAFVNLLVYPPLSSLLPLPLHPSPFPLPSLSLPSLLARSFEHMSSPFSRPSLSLSPPSSPFLARDLSFRCRLRADGSSRRWRCRRILQYTAVHTARHVACTNSAEIEGNPTVGCVASTA